jgi:hypothetical protein
MTTQGFLFRTRHDEDLPVILRLYARNRLLKHSGIKTKEMAEFSADWSIIVLRTWAMGQPDCARRAEQSHNQRLFWRFDE